VLAGIHPERDGRQDRAESRHRSRRRTHPDPRRARPAARYAGPSAPRLGRAAAPPGTTSADIGIAEAILDAGLARYRPDAAAHPCRDLLLAAESEARATKIGLWADPYYAVLNTGDRAAFANPRTGMVIVEGVAASIGETAARYYLNFGPSRGSDFAITLPKRGANALEKAGLKVQDRVGKRLRVRGLLDATFGPQMELTDPDQLELID
jgi:hypothetical protein